MRRFYTTALNLYSARSTGLPTIENIPGLYANDSVLRCSVFIMS